MRLLRIPEPEHAPFADSTLPLINVVFLLLIFIMLSGVIRATDPVPVDPAISTADSEHEEFDDSRTLFVAADGTATFRGLSNDGAIVASMARYYDEEEWERALLKADRTTPARRIVDLTLLLRQAGIPKLVMVVEKAP